MKCNCGSKEFLVQEYIIYKAVSDKDEKDILDCWHISDNGIENIICGKCSQEIDEVKFSEIQFNA